MVITSAKGDDDRLIQAKNHHASLSFRFWSSSEARIINLVRIRCLWRGICFGRSHLAFCKGAVSRAHELLTGGRLRIAVDELLAAVLVEDTNEIRCSIGKGAGTGCTAVRSVCVCVCV